MDTEAALKHAVCPSRRCDYTTVWYTEAVLKHAVCRSRRDHTTVWILKPFSSMQSVQAEGVTNYCVDTEAVLKHAVCPSRRIDHTTVWILKLCSSMQSVQAEGVIIRLCGY